jgi:hypothetical protein
MARTIAPSPADGSSTRAPGASSSTPAWMHSSAARSSGVATYPSVARTVRSMAPLSSTASRAAVGSSGKTWARVRPPFQAPPMLPSTFATAT